MGYGRCRDGCMGWGVGISVGLGVGMGVGISGGIGVWARGAPMGCASPLGVYGPGVRDQCIFRS